MNSQKLNFIFKYILIFGLLLNYSKAFGITGGRKVHSRDRIASNTVMIWGSSESNSHEVLCSGVIIEEDIIVTTAHCLSGDLDSMRVVFGKSFLNSNFEADVLVAEILPPILSEGVTPLYSDVAVLKISEKLPVGFHKVKLLREKIDFKKVTSFLIAGFGRTSYLKSDAGVLRKAKLEYASVNSNYPYLILLSQGLTGACPGDSGGPAYIEKNGELYFWGIAATIYDLGAALEDVPLGLKKDAKCGTSVEYINLTSPQVFSELKKSIAHIKGKSKKIHIK